MKRRIFSLIAVFSLTFFSCTHNDLKPDTGFIKAKVNGEDVVYSAVPKNLDFDVNYIKPGALNIWFNKDNTSSQYWAITIMYGNTTLDVNKLPLPFVIKGPNLDFTGKSPEVTMGIVNPDGAPYGEVIAQASTSDHPFTLEITSIKNDVIKGTFTGTGFGKFEQGQFSAKLKRENW